MAIDRSGEIATNLEAVRDQISKAASIAGRALDEITLIAVTKTFPASDVEILRDLGVNDFGENRDADAAPKAAAVGGTWHFQGQIQSNKLKSITSWANVIHSLDEIRHFEVIEKSAPYPLDIFCQVSLDGSAGRGGVSEQKLYELAQAIEKSATHRLQGLMAVAPLGVDPSDAFSKLSVIHKAFMADFPKADKLSAGMSGDFKEAIAYGATHIRIGSSILGSRYAYRYRCVMANALKRVANYLGLMDDPEFDTPIASTTSAVATSSEVRIKARLPRPVSSVDAPPQLDLPVLDRIVTLHPRFYNEARTIGEHFRLGNPVIINLTDMDESEHKRLVDFASGLAFGLHGTIERVTKKVFLLSPANVSIDVEDKSAAAQASFFNQS